MRIRFKGGFNTTKREEAIELLLNTTIVLSDNVFIVVETWRKWTMGKYCVGNIYILKG